MISLHSYSYTLGDSNYRSELEYSSKNTENYIGGKGSYEVSKKGHHSISLIAEDRIPTSYYKNKSEEYKSTPLTQSECILLTENKSLHNIQKLDDQALELGSCIKSLRDEKKLSEGNSKEVKTKQLSRINKYIDIFIQSAALLIIHPFSRITQKAIISNKLNELNSHKRKNLDNKVSEIAKNIDLSPIDMAFIENSHKSNKAFRELKTEEKISLFYYNLINDLIDKLNSELTDSDIELYIDKEEKVIKTRYKKDKDKIPSSSKSSSSIEHISMEKPETLSIYASRQQLASNKSSQINDTNSITFNFSIDGHNHPYILDINDEKKSEIENIFRNVNQINNQIGELIHINQTRDIDSQERKEKILEICENLSLFIDYRNEYSEKEILNIYDDFINLFLYSFSYELTEDEYSIIYKAFKEVMIDLDTNHFHEEEFEVYYSERD